MQDVFKRIYRVALRECGIMRRNGIYLTCLVAFPLLVMTFFTTLMGSGQPHDTPIGVVDLDNTSTTRKLVRTLDAFQSSRVVARFPNVNAARNAMQRNEIYGFLYIPRHTTDDLLASRQPRVSYYYSMTSLTAGALVYRDLKTIATLGSASVGKATMSAKGYTDDQIMTFLQPIKVDLHQVSNPWTDYNVYLSTMLVPGVILLFMLMVSAYSIGTELKFNRSKKWLEEAGGNMFVALAGKMLPQTLISLTIVYVYMYYVFGILEFPHPGGTLNIMLTGLLMVLASQGFGIFLFGLMPSLRMSMSICSLWAVLSFSMVGTAFPVMAMDSELQALAWLFPLHHYFVIYQLCIFNDYPLVDAWFSIGCLALFALLPLLVIGKFRNAMLHYVYIP